MGNWVGGVSGRGKVVSFNNKDTFLEKTSDKIMLEVKRKEKSRWITEEN